MKIKDLMTRDVECLDPRSSLKQAAKLMSEADVGSIPVVEDGQVVGLLTDRDIVVRTVAAGINPSETTVGDVMTLEVIRCREDDDVENAAELMTAHNIRRVVVTDDQGGLAGIVALADLAARAADDEEASVASLVKGELAAVRTYRMALEKFGSGASAGDLRRIENDHREAARLLREGMSDPDRNPGEPGPWRAFAEAVEGAAKRFGETAVLKALKSGEELEICDYHQALDDERVSPEVKYVICETLLPRTWSHVSALERCLQTGSSA